MAEIDAAVTDLPELDVVVVPAGDLAVLQVDRWVSPKEAEQIKTTWRAVTGRECVLLTAGLRVGGVVEDAGTPIFDELMAERRPRAQRQAGPALHVHIGR